MESLPSLEQFRQARDDQRLVAWVQSEYQTMRSARSKIVNEWNINIAFYYGNQYLELQNKITGSQLRVPKAPPHRVRQTINRIRPMIRTELSRITSQKPSASVIPATASDEDLAAAYAAEQLWESISRNNMMDVEFRIAAFWTLITGTGFMKTWWDPSIGPTMQDPMTGMSRTLGDVKFAAVTPYHLMVPDLRTVQLQDQPYVIHVFTLTVDKLRAIYGDETVRGFNIQPNVVSQNEVLQDATLNLSGSDRQPDSVLCFELWAKPGATRYLPQGGLVHIAGNNVIYAARDGIPYQHGRFPFTKFEHIPTGKFYAESSIVDLRPLQREYNRSRSQITEAANRMGKPQLLVAKGSVDPRKITTEPGLAIEYRPGLPAPTPLPLQPLPNYVVEQQDRILSDFEDISGQHQVSKGSAPSGVTAATAISFLQEKDDSILNHTYFSVEKGMEDVAFQTLNLIVQFWDEERTVRTVGADGAFDTLLLRGSDLANSTDIRMEGGSALPTSKAAKQALLMDMMKMSFITPQDGLKMLDFGGVNKLWEKLRIDESQAQRENIKLKKADPLQLAQFQEDQRASNEEFMQRAMQQMDQEAAENGGPLMDPETGMPQLPPEAPPMESILPVNTWDNHQVHLEVHNNFRKSQEFEMLDQAIKNEFEAHCNMHIAAINAAMQEIADAQMAGMVGEDTGQAPPPGTDLGPGEPPPSPAESQS